MFVTNATKFVISLTRATTRGTVEMVVSLAIVVITAVAVAYHVHSYN